jgi:hypothetical protein
MGGTIRSIGFGRPSDSEKIADVVCDSWHAGCEHDQQRDRRENHHRDEKHPKLDGWAMTSLFGKGVCMMGC